MSAARDGWKIVAAVDADESLLRTLGALRIEAGRRAEGPRIDMRLEQGERTLLVDLGPEVLEHPQGRVDGARFELRRFPIDPSPLLAGAWLRVRDRLPDSSVFRLLSEDGAFEPASPPQRGRWLRELLLERFVDTEPCPPPIGPLEPALSGVEDVFSDTLRLPDLGREVRDLHAPAPGVWVMLGRTSIKVARDGQLPERSSPGAFPRDVVEPRDLGGVAVFSHLAPGPDGRYFVVGDVRGVGTMWVFGYKPDGLDLVDTATVSDIPLDAVAVFGGRVGATDVDGHGYVASDPRGPWTRIPAPDQAAVFKTLVFGTEDGRLLRTVDERVDLIAGGSWPPLSLSSPFQRSGLVETGLWDGSSVLAGTEEGDVFRIFGGAQDRLDLSPPPRLRACSSVSQPVDDIHIGQKIVGMARLGAYLVMVFDGCSAVIAHRLQDRCSGFVLPQGEPEPRPLMSTYRGLFVQDERLFVATDDGLLLSAELRTER